MFYPSNMYDTPMPDVLWSDDAIIDYAARFLPMLPIVYVPLAFQVNSSQPDTAKVERGSVIRFNR